MWEIRSCKINFKKLVLLGGCSPTRAGKARLYVLKKIILAYFLGDWLSWYRPIDPRTKIKRYNFCKEFHVLSLWWEVFSRKNQYLWRYSQNTIFQYAFSTRGGGAGGALRTPRGEGFVCLLVSSSQQLYQVSILRQFFHFYFLILLDYIVCNNLNFDAPRPSSIMGSNIRFFQEIFLKEIL